MTRYACRRDANEPELVTLARKLGAFMYRTDKPGDWLCGFRGAWSVVEIKVLDGQYTPAQVAFRHEAEERRLPYWTWRTDEDVFRYLSSRRVA